MSTYNITNGGTGSTPFQVGSVTQLPISHVNPVTTTSSAPSFTATTWGSALADVHDYGKINAEISALGVALENKLVVIRRKLQAMHSVSEAYKISAYAGAYADACRDLKVFAAAKMGPEFLTEHLTFTWRKSYD